MTATPTPTVTRIDKLRQRLGAVEIDALLVTDEVNVRYLSGFTGDSSYLLIHDGGAIILSDRRYETQIAGECPNLSAAIRGPSKLMPELVTEVLADFAGRRIGFEADQVTVATLRRTRQQLQKAGVQADLVETDGLVEGLRRIKDAGEIDLICQAIDVAERAFRSVTSRLTPRMTERDVAFDLESVMRSLGASGVSFTPIVGVQPSGALPHYCPADVPLADTPTLLVDWGASFGGYASDLTRTLHQDSAGDRFRRCYGHVLEAQLAAIDTIRDGVPAKDVDTAARRVLEAAGLGDAFKHGLGHGIGLQIHESPRMASVSEETLASGMVITVEPGVYFEGDFGIRIEDDVLVTDSGCRVLTRLPKGLDDCGLIL